MFCSKCGTQNAGQGFCTNCGAALNVTQVAESQLPAASASSTSNTLSTLAIVLGAVSFLFVPLVFGVAGLVLGIIAKTKGESKSSMAIVVSSLGLVLGLIFGSIVGASSF